MAIKRIGLKIPKIFRSILFITLGTSWVTGIIFFILRDFVTIEGEFGPQKHPMQFPILTIHGAAAFLMMIWFGSMVSAHIPMGWRIKKLRFWGICMTSAVVTQIVTAYLLYYMTSEELRIIVGYIHLTVGFLLPFMLLVHIVKKVKLGSKQ